MNIFVNFNFENIKKNKAAKTSNLHYQVMNKPSLKIKLNFYKTLFGGTG